MSYITYSEEEMERLFHSWETILVSWDDKKSRELDSSCFEPMMLSAEQLIELSHEIHRIINGLADECDSV